MGAAVAAERGGEFGDVGPAGADVHSQAPRDRVVDVPPLDEQLGYGTLDTAEATGYGVVLDLFTQRCGPGPQLLEHLDQVLDEAGVAQFQGVLPVVRRRDERDGAIEDDEPLDELFEGPDLDILVGYLLGVRQGSGGAVADRVLVEGANADTAVHYGQPALQCLIEPVLAPATAGLDGEDFGQALCSGQIERRVDSVEASSTVMAWVVGASCALMSMNGTKDSASRTECRRRSWISRSMGGLRCFASAADGGTGLSQAASSGVGGAAARSP